MTPLELIYSATALGVAGGIKGYAGIGLPMIAIPALAMLLPMDRAIALMVLPVLLANLWQARNLPRELLDNHWFSVLAVSLLLGIAGGYLLLPADSRFLSLMVGVSMTAFSLLCLTGYRLSISSSVRRPLAVVFGCTAGLIGGSTSLYGWPLVIFLSSAGLPPRQFVATISCLYLVGHLGFMLSTGLQLNLTLSGVGQSMLACGPVFVGIAAGQWLRARSGEQQLFYQLVYLLMLIGGAGLILQVL
ncbi:sulfite exporter TauE/SafE family protein [Marinobacterium nitratireducens]|uniref:sulfite exporter TauE/SafE family protein n=1 Tax=Marinobacterium nitratireducens TaxID=518897 RepID=UPI0016646F3A|nr:sulfite exporter TauE/SafE family protein [Marinobacterium nitratireducens]